MENSIIEIDQRPGSKRRSGACRVLTGTLRLAVGILKK